MLSPSHLIIVFLVALLVFGPEKLPELARTLSKAMGEFHRLTGDFQETLQREMRQLESETSRHEPPRGEDAYEGTVSPVPDTASEALPEGDSPGAGPADAPETGSAPASEFEEYCYDDASYVASVAEGPGEKWAEQTSGETTQEGSPSGEPAAETSPDHNSPPESGNSSSEDKPSVAGDAENPVNDHPTAA